MTITDQASLTRVLLVEDAESFVDALVVGLEREGFEVTVARDGVEALELFDDKAIDLVLLDVMLPRLSGIDVCRAIRARSDVPIIMVTAKASELDAVVGLEVGADDYVAKPYRLRELVSRMRAVTRRRKGSMPAPPLLRQSGHLQPPANGEAVVDGRPGEVLEAAGVRLDVGRHDCTVRGSEVRLPLKEFELLELLLENAGRVVTRDSLIDRVWGLDYVGDTKTLDVHIKRLRAKLEPDPSQPVLITTIRGVGYRFEVPRS
ncbi:MAG: response regulator transcription factor [Acidimicrobiales bacterium]